MCPSRSFRLALVLTILAAPAARAEDDTFIGVGGHVITSFTPGSDDDAVLSYGAQVRVRPFRKIAFEGALGVRKEEFSSGTIEAKAYPIQASLLFFVLTGRLDVYVLGGVSYLVVDVSDTLTGNDDVIKVPGPHFGGGVQLKLYGPWRVHADARYLIADDDFEGRTLDYDGALINAGISYWW